MMRPIAKLLWTLGSVFAPLFYALADRERQNHVSNHFQQVLSAADEPARRASSRPWCCTQSWTVTVTATVVRRMLQVPWRNFSKSRVFGMKFQREITLVLEISKFPNNTVWGIDVSGEEERVAR